MMFINVFIFILSVFEAAPLYSLFVNMFPLAGVPVGPESYCLQCRYVSLKFSQGQNVFCTGGYKEYWGNKTCNYVYKYSFVFLNIQFLSIVFLSTAKSLQTITNLI